MLQLEVGLMDEMSRRASLGSVALRDLAFEGGFAAQNVEAVDTLFPSDEVGASIALVFVAWIEKIATRVKNDLVVDSLILPVI